MLIFMLSDRKVRTASGLVVCRAGTVADVTDGHGAELIGMKAARRYVPPPPPEAPPAETDPDADAAPPAGPMSTKSAGALAGKAKAKR